MISSAPFKLKTLLLFLVFTRLLQGFVVGGFLGAVVWALVLGMLSRRLLLKTPRAAVILGYLCFVLGGVSALLPSLYSSISALGTAWCMAWGALAIYTGWYVLKSREVKLFLSQAIPANPTQAASPAGDA